MPTHDFSMNLTKNPCPIHRALVLCDEWVYRPRLADLFVRPRQPSHRTGALRRQSLRLPLTIGRERQARANVLFRQVGKIAQYFRMRHPLRQVGALLGEALREQAGESLYQAVEDLRRTAIARRDADATAHDVPNSTDALAALAEQHLQHALTRVQSLTSDTAYQLARAFAFFFELTNLAETNYRKRRHLSSQPYPLRRPNHHHRASPKPACSA